MSTNVPAYEEAHAPRLVTATLRWEAASSRKLVILSAIAGIAGVVVTLLGAMSEPEVALSSYLVNFMFFLALTQGALFFVMLHHITTSRWGITVRRIAESLMRSFWILAILFLPIAFGAHHLFEWMDPKVMNASAVLAHKKAWLNPAFFYIRAVIYFAVWITLAQILWRGSIQQDGGKDTMPFMRKLSAPGILLNALAVTFAGFDWLMSLDPEWYSTIFGVYVFAGGVQGMFAVLIVAALLLKRGGLLQGAVTVEHFHDLGKFAFGFTIFFAYIAFSQYLLIWYGNIPEETEWYLRRWGPWAGISIALIFFTFVLPFLVLISRQAKRVMPILITGAVLILVGRFIDVFWLIKPAFDHEAAGPHLHWTLITSFLGIGGLWLAVFAWNLGSNLLIPVGDPLLRASLGHENV